MIRRELQKELRRAAKQFPVVGVLGPRQSGKTTLVKASFKSYPYVSLEKPSDLEFALEDPEGFLAQFPKGAIIDEIQRSPKLFSYIQVIVDKKPKAGRYILTGSQNFGLLEKITQSLAGRISLQKLLPFSMGELTKGKVLPKNLWDLLLKGGYPRIYDQHLNPSDWLSNYVLTYLERDVRKIKNIGDLSTFQRFLRMCAFRSGKILNLSSLANDCGITHNTAKAWLSVLEASFIIILLNPFHKNFNKRLIKSPKLYFLDAGLLCHLMGISQAKDLNLHPEIGPIFETFVISELFKIRFNQNLPSNLYFWRDKLGREIDCVAEKGQKTIPIEIKSGQTINQGFFKNLDYWAYLTNSKTSDSIVIYGGSKTQNRLKGRVICWQDIVKLSSEI